MGFVMSQYLLDQNSFFLVILTNFCGSFTDSVWDVGVFLFIQE